MESAPTPESARPIYPGNGAAGGLPVFTAQGGTNSMVSLDAMREFRIESSSASAGLRPHAGCANFHRDPVWHESFSRLACSITFAMTCSTPTIGLPIAPACPSLRNDRMISEERSVVRSEEGARSFSFLTKDCGFDCRCLHFRRARRCQRCGRPELAGNRSSANAAYLNAFPLAERAGDSASRAIASDPSCPASGQKAERRSDLSMRRIPIARHSTRTACASITPRRRRSTCLADLAIRPRI